MPSLILIVPGPLETRTGGYEYDRRMVAGLRAGGWTVGVRELAGRLPRPPAAEIGREADAAARLESSERRGLDSATLVIVTGRTTISALARYGIGRDRIALVEPGTDRAPLARGSGGPTVELLSVATLNAGKGHEVLFRALGMIPQRNWHLTCAGSLERDRSIVERLRVQLRADGLEDRVTLVGEL